ncbi:major facilitator superfamily protein [Burkholderia cenocepacia]|uniref:Major facilitator superfamily protein n=2 Tax=Burkholderia cepacia complex TaxID=87882 RepID=A0A6J5JAD3_9BURK|nr:MULTISPECIES: MFS transporter [Burkholderia cepacia complex]RQT16298.1 MFS transporter [Burkholderia contaminans]CAB3968421.1 major facilitator superfamily protein [Burkholderia cenocepacia]
MTVHLRYCLQQAALWGTFGLVLPVVTLFLLHSHFTLFEIGLYAAVFSLSTIALELPFGAMADRVGRIRTYRVSLLMNSIGCALMLCFSQKPVLYLAAASFGVARAMSSGTVDAWYVGLLREHGETNRIPYFLGRAELASALGLASMSLVGGVLPDLIGSRLFDNPYRIGLALAGGLFIVLLGLTSWFFAEAEQAPPEAVPAGRMRDDLRELVRFAWHGGAVRPLILLCMLLGGVVSVLESYWPVVLKTLVPMHGATWAFGLFLTLMLVVKGAGGWVSYRVMKHCAARPALAVSLPFAGLAASLVLTRWANHVVAFGAVLSGVALFLGIAGAVVNAVLHHRTPDALRSRAVSFFSLVFQLGSMIASILLGYLVSQWGVQAVWCGVGVLVAAAAGYGASIGGWAADPMEEAKTTARA